MRGNFGTLTPHLIPKSFRQVKSYFGNSLLARTTSRDIIYLVTKIKKNMKNSLMLLQDKILLRKRALIETVNETS